MLPRLVGDLVYYGPRPQGQGQGQEGSAGRRRGTSPGAVEAVLLALYCSLGMRRRPGIAATGAQASHRRQHHQMTPAPVVANTTGALPRWLCAA